jgi:hypothetical protein
MLTEELEHELRSALARAAAGIPDPEQARQRLLHRDYRPGRGHGRLAAGTAAVATAGAAVALGMGVTGALGSAPAHHAGAIRTTPPAAGGTIRTTAFTLVKHANGTATLTINPGVLLEPSVLQSDLQQDGIPAMVTSGSFCSSDPTPAGFQQVVTGQKRPSTLTINPAAIPDGTELSFGYFQDASVHEAVIALAEENSYTCTTTVPTSPPPGAGLMEVHATGGPGDKAKSPFGPGSKGSPLGGRVPAKNAAGR